MILSEEYSSKSISSVLLFIPALHSSSSFLTPTMLNRSTKTMFYNSFSRATALRARTSVHGRQKHPQTQVRSFYSGLELIPPLAAFASVVLPSMIHIVKPNERAVVVQLGKYDKTLEDGLTFTLPYPITIVKRVNIDERTIEIRDMTVITSDQLNIQIDAIVFYRITDPYKSTYNVNDFEASLKLLVQSVLRDTLGQVKFTDANSKRAMINEMLRVALESQVAQWGADVPKVVLLEAHPPFEVQTSMNSITVAEQGQIAANHTAEQEVILARGRRNAAIMDAEALAESAVIAANAQAEAVSITCKADQEHLVGPAMERFRIDQTSAAMARNTTVILGEGNKNMLNVMDFAAQK